MKFTQSCEVDSSIVNPRCFRNELLKFSESSFQLYVLAYVVLVEQIMRIGKPKTLRPRLKYQIHRGDVNDKLNPSMISTRRC